MLLLSVDTYANMDAYCEKEAANFGSGLGRDRISTDCSFHVSHKVSPKLFRKSVDGKISVSGFGNMIFINDPSSKLKGQNVIAGKYTELDEIQALALDEVNKEIVVLLKSGDVLFFSSVITGNVAPKRTLKHKDLEGAVDVVVNPGKQEVLILNPEKKELLSFSRLANTHAPEKKRNLDLKYSLEILRGDKLLINLTKQQLSIVDSTSKWIQNYDLKGSVPKPILVK